CEGLFRPLRVPEHHHGAVRRVPETPPAEGRPEVGGAGAGRGVALPAGAAGDGAHLPGGGAGAGPEAGEGVGGGEDGRKGPENGGLVHAGVAAPVERAAGKVDGGAAEGAGRRAGADAADQRGGAVLVAAAGGPASLRAGVPA